MTVQKNKKIVDKRRKILNSKKKYDELQSTFKKFENEFYSISREMFGIFEENCILFTKLNSELCCCKSTEEGYQYSHNFECVCEIHNYEDTAEYDEEYLYCELCNDEERLLYSSDCIKKGKIEVCERCLLKAHPNIKELPDELFDCQAYLKFKYLLSSSFENNKISFKTIQDFDELFEIKKKLEDDNEYMTNLLKKGNSYQIPDKYKWYNYELNLSEIIQ